MQIKYPRGVRDLKPNEAIFREQIINQIKITFQNFGFYPIDTPIFESLDVLLVKHAIGDENRLIYKLSSGNLGLRYDHTISLARFFAMHQEIHLPFKRYVIDKAWRKEEPQKLRYREFTQADIDILGGNEIDTIAEVIAAIAKSFEKININYEIHLNDRQILDALFESFNIDQELSIKIMRIIDKYDKLSKDQISDLLKELNLSAEIINQIILFITDDADNNTKLKYVGDLLKEKGIPLINRLNELLQIIKLYNLKSKIFIDFSIIRGLDYYTSLIFEFKLVDKNTSLSIAGGGRYDKLISLYSNKTMSAVGGSIGIDRILNFLNYSAIEKYSYSEIFIAYINHINYNYALKVANLLRDNNINIDLNVSNKNISSQLFYANILKFKYVIIIGNKEQNLNAINLRDLRTGSEQSINLNNLVDNLNLLLKKE